jgi:prevent-host-death family protein
MAAPVNYFGPRILSSVSTNELRANLSETVGRAAFGGEPVLIERRGRKIAAIVSIDDLVLLERMRQRRDEAVAQELPKDQSQIGAAIAERLRRELFFG